MRQLNGRKRYFIYQPLVKKSLDVTVQLKGRPYRGSAVIYLCGTSKDTCSHYN